MSHTGNYDGFMIYVKLITDYENFFWYTPIDILILDNDHYLKVFIVNPDFAVDPSMINDLEDMERDNSSCIMYCNSIKYHSLHEKKNVALTVIKMLNCFNGENMRSYNLNVPSQKDKLSCNLQLMLAMDVFVFALLDEKKYVTNADHEDNFKLFG